MQTLRKYITPQLRTLKENGFLSVLYALLLEAVFIGFLGFMGLFTLETLLPTFITVRFSLAGYLTCLTLLTFLLAALGRYLDIHYTLHFKQSRFLLSLGLIWALSILLVSLYKFPWFSIPLLIGGFFLSGWLFWKILFLEEKK